MVKAVRATIVFHWGYSIKHPMYSASQPALKFPPPTTLIGALSYPYTRVNGPEVESKSGQLYSSSIRLLDHVLWACYKIVDFDPRMLVETRDIIRALIVPYVRSEHVYPGSKFLWAIQVHGKVCAPALKLDTVFIVDDDSAETVSQYAWGIARVGSKESIVSVESVSVLDIETEEKSDVVSTSFCFPKELAQNIKGGYVEEMMPAPSREWFMLGTIRDVSKYMQAFAIPIEKVEVSLSSTATALYVKGLEPIIVPRGVVGRG
jgi:CRISPR-associated protein Cas5a/b/c